MRAGIIVAGVLAVGLAVVVAMNMQKAAPPPQATAPVVNAPALKTVNVYVAAQSIPVGTRITQEMLAVQPWPEHLMLDGFIKSDDGAKNAVGFVARAAFQQNEPVIASKLANPSDPNFLAGELPKGMRVVSIMTTETDGVAGFVFPGDRVDVMLTHEVAMRERSVDPATFAMTEKEKTRSFTEALVANVKVVAVDQRSSGAKSTDSEGKLLIPRSVSLMVSSTDAQRLRLGQKIGTLTLALRSLEDRDSSDPLTVTGEPDVSQVMAKGGDFDVAPDSEVRVYRGAKSEDAKGKSPLTALIEAMVKSESAAKSSSNQTNMVP